MRLDLPVCKSRPVLIAGVALLVLSLGACGRRDKPSQASTNGNSTAGQAPAQAAAPAGDSEATLKDQVRSPAPPPQAQAEAPGPEAERLAELTKEIVRIDTGLMQARKEADVFRAQAASKPEARERIQRLQAIRAEKAAFVADYPPWQEARELAVHAQAAAAERAAKIDLHVQHSEHGKKAPDGTEPAPVAGCEFCEQDRSGATASAEDREKALRDMAVSAFEAEEQARQARRDIFRTEQEAWATEEGQAIVQREREALDAVEQVLRTDPEVARRLRTAEDGARKRAELEEKVQQLRLDRRGAVQREGARPPERLPEADQSQPSGG